MKIIFILLFFYSCGQTYNSNTNDHNLFTNANIDTSTPGGLRLSKAYTIIQNKCTNCHTKRHAHWTNFTTDSDWYINEKGEVLVQPNNAAESAIIYRLKIWGTVGGMPDGPEQITEDEYNILKDWIDNIGT